jgi:hypothetical protein
MVALRTTKFGKNPRAHAKAKFSRLSKSELLGKSILSAGNFHRLIFIRASPTFVSIPETMYFASYPLNPPKIKDFFIGQDQPVWNLNFLVNTNNEPGHGVYEASV